MSHKREVGGTAFPWVPLHFNHWAQVRNLALIWTLRRSLKPEINPGSADDGSVILCHPKFRFSSISPFEKLGLLPAPENFGPEIC